MVKKKETKKKGFNSMSDVLDFAYTSLERLRNGRYTVEQVRAEAAQLNNVSKFVGDRLRFARLAGTIKKGSKTLPDIEFE